MTAFADSLSRWVWEHRYRWTPAGGVAEDGLEATWRRVAEAVARAEPAGRRERWQQSFLELLEGCRFLPGGRILANAGTGRVATLLNCFVMGRIDDSLPGICRALEESTLTLQQGGGIGLDFSTLRPRGSTAGATGMTASGPVSFMHVWNTMCATLLATGNRRGAMLAALRCDHPDVCEFIDAKRDPESLRFFNLSVSVTDDFLAAVRDGRDWPLVFPLLPGERAGVEAHRRSWPGCDEPVACRVHRVVRAGELWQRLLAANHACAEPGVQFIDTVNSRNNLYWRESLAASNPCGEEPLPPHGACNLGSLNLPRFVREPFTPQATLDCDSLSAAARLAVRFLDDVLDVTGFPLEAQGREVRSCRRIGLGITGLADALAMLGLRYDTAAARAAAANAMHCVCTSAYEASAELALEKAEFPALDRQRYLEADLVRRLPGRIRDAIRAGGLRNSHLTAIAPAGTISLLAGNVSSGIEPMFAFDGERTVLDAAGLPVRFPATNDAVRRWRSMHGHAPLPPAFVTATELDPQAHLQMQAALQPWVDGAISKTINLPADFPRERYGELFESAHARGLKGCTTYRPGTLRGQVAALGERGVDATLLPVERCCALG
jgi:ribonucleoside-diphosphate reductase alpha chain